MIKKYLLFIIVFFICTKSFAFYFHGVYDIDINPKERIYCCIFPITPHNITCYLELSDSNKFCLYFETNVSDDLVETAILSFGYYQEYKNILTLHDENLKYDITFFIVYDNAKKEYSLKGKQIFRYLQSQNFHKIESHFENNTDFFESMKMDIIKEKLALNKILGKNRIWQCFSVAGNYTLGYYASLYLGKDYTFCYKILGIPIIEGRYVVSGSEIMLLDNSLNTVFYVYIQEFGLNGKLLPGCFHDKSIFMKQLN
jgi:hypothetical protein